MGYTRDPPHLCCYVVGALGGVGGSLNVPFPGLSELPVELAKCLLPMSCSVDGSGLARHRVGEPLRVTQVKLPGQFPPSSWSVLLLLVLVLGLGYTW